MGRVEFISASGGKMFVDESRVEEYKAAGYMLAASVVDVEFKEDTPKPKRKKKEEV